MIINISSRAGIVGLPILSLYCAAKFALEVFSESLAYELASQNIIVKIVEPSGGITNTNFFERMGKEQAQGISLTDYDIFVARMSSVFAGMQSGRTRCRGNIRCHKGRHDPASLFRRRGRRRSGSSEARNVRSELYRVRKITVSAEVLNS